jgi:hypothetical protein
MAAWTLTFAKARLLEYLTAEQKVLDGQAYQIAGRAMTRADLESIQKGIDKWRREVDRLERGGGIKLQQGVPV